MTIGRYCQKKNKNILNSTIIITKDALDYKTNSAHENRSCVKYAYLYLYTYYFRYLLEYI